MPNWCEGTLRLRGKRKDIVEFLKNNLRGVGLNPENFDSIDWPVRVTEENDGQSIFVCGDNEKHRDSCGWLWIKDTKRNFIAENEIYVDMYGDEDKTYTICIDGFNAALGIKPEPYVAFSKKYDLDIKIFASEQGMQFEQCIEIVNGKLVKDEQRNYDDWYWEAVNPNMGG